MATAMQTCTVTTAPPTLALYSEDVLSKWGFRDGDTPEELLDYWDDQGVNYSDDHWDDWHTVLRRLVREHLVPALAQHHQIEVVDIDTLHNPIRATRIDGVDVTDCWYGDQPGPVLTPEFVIIQYPVIAAAFRM